MLREPAPTEAPDPVASGAVASDSLVFGFWTAISRITGLGRMATIAAVLGPTYMGNTFQAANLLPNAIFDLLIGSVLVNVLVPPLVEHLRKGRRDDVERLAGGALGVALAALAVIVAVLVVTRPLLLRIFTLGVQDDTVAAAQRGVGSLLLLLVLPQILLYAVAGVAGAVLNATGRFALSAAAPALENVATIAVFVVAATTFGTGRDVQDVGTPLVLTLGLGATAAVLIHAFVVVAGCLRAGIRLRPRWIPHDPLVRSLVRDAWPTIAQAALLTSRTLALLVVGNAVRGGVVALQMALTFFYLPPALSARAVGASLLRRLSILFGDRDRSGFRREFTHGVALTIFLTVPAAALYVFMAEPLVRAVSFGEMAVDDSGVRLASAALVALAPALLGETAFLLASSASFAARDPRAPLRPMVLRTAITVAAMLVAAFVTDGIVLIALIGASVSLGNTVGALRLARHLRRGALDVRWQATDPFVRAALSSALMLTIAVPFAGALREPLGAIGSLVLASAAGALAYVTLQRLLHAPELGAYLAPAGRVLRTNGAAIGRVLRTPRFPRALSTLTPGDGWTIAGLATATAAGAVAAWSPAVAAAVAAGLVLVVAVVRRPPIAAYVILGATPLLVGMNRGSVLPAVRPHEALIALVGVTLIARLVLRRVAFGERTGVTLKPVDGAVALLAVAGSVLPILWLLARGEQPSADDMLYALVLVKFAVTYAMVRVAVRSTVEVRRCLWVSLSATALVAIVGTLQAVGAPGVPALVERLFPPDGLTAAIPGGRATATFGNAVAFADVMAMHTVIALGMLVRRLGPRLVLVPLAGLFGIASLASGQLSGAIALLVALLVAAVLTGQTRRLAVACGIVLILGALILQPVIRQRLRNVDSATGLPQSWVARRDNLRDYVLPELGSPERIALGVRPAARIPAREFWRDWVYIESGYIWVLWTGGIPLLAAFVLYVHRGLRMTSRVGRSRGDAVGVAAVTASASLAAVVVLMALDPHLTMRGSADLSFSLVALSLVGAASVWRPVRLPASSL